MRAKPRRQKTSHWAHVGDRGERGRVFIRETCSFYIFLNTVLNRYDILKRSQERG